MYPHPNRAARSNCGCLGDCVAPLFYSTKLFYLDDFGDVDHTVCCMSVELRIECESGSCVYNISITTPGLPAATLTGAPTPTSCDPIAIGPYDWNFSNATDCLENTILGGGRKVTLTIAESPPGGTEATPCDKLCCDTVPDVVYATIDCPDCPSIDGKVVECKFYAAGEMVIPGSPPNALGEHSISWTGVLQCNCNKELVVTVAQNTWSDPDNGVECRWRVILGSLILGACFDEETSQSDDDFCLPATVSGTFDTSDTNCSDCCDASGAAISITVTE